MEPDKTRVIITSGATAGTSRVHHRDFPEIRADGQTPLEAAEHLTKQLSRALDSALTNWRRESIQNAVADVQAFSKSAG